jgi:hypothetical protein
MTYEKDYSKENVKLIFNVSKGLINYSQRNNEYVWKRKKLIVRNTNTCNTTSLCMGSSYAGWIFPKEPYPEFEQEEDRLTKFCLEDPRVSEFYKKKMYTLWKQWQDGDEDAFPPNQIHEILEFAVNTWFGSTVVKFNLDTPINDIFNEIVFKNIPGVV